MRDLFQQERTDWLALHLLDNLLTAAKFSIRDVDAQWSAENVAEDFVFDGGACFQKGADCRHVAVERRVI